MIMEKKQYIIPLVEVALWNMQVLQHASGTSPNLPEDPTLAPAREKVF